ncbi:MAG: stage III sporulation protein AA [Defluviitaleaceae bacterium]|nr:stage III sporulation protein AA [Defluviitaleaceae bacterium]
MMKVKQMLMQYASGGLKQVFAACNEQIEQSMEIRIRLGKPILARSTKGEIRVGSDYTTTSQDIMGMLEKMANHSLYAFDSEIKNGFITVAGGHRVGICGRVVLDGGKIKTMRNISGLTIRISRQIIGAGEHIAKIVTDGRSPLPLHNILIVSPPSSGKTTVLRDLIRILSNNGCNISVVDERSEIAGSHNGAAQNDLGARTDVLDAAPKAEGMLLMLRAMSPDVIAVDEIGHDADVDALLAIACCGVKIIATCHAENIEDLHKKPAFAPIIKNKIFERYIFLTAKPKPGTVKAVYDKNLQEVGGK